MYKVIILNDEDNEVKRFPCEQFVFYGGTQREDGWIIGDGVTVGCYETLCRMLTTASASVHERYVKHIDDEIRASRPKT